MLFFQTEKRTAEEKVSGVLVTLLLLVLSIGFAYYLIGDNLAADWGIIDEHDIIRSLGPDQSLRLSEIPHQFCATMDNLCEPGTSTRYRPSFLLRIIETWLWGGNTFLWYLARVFMLGVVIAVVCHLLVRPFGFFLACMLTGYLFSYMFWGDIWGKIGGLDAYGVVGTAIFALFYVRMVHPVSGTAVGTLDYLGITAAYCVAVGARENLLILALPATWLLVVCMRRERRHLASSVAAIIMAGYSLLIVYAVVRGVRMAGGDVYGNSVGLGHRFGIMAAALQDKYFLLMLIIVISLLLGQFVSRHQTEQTGLAKDMRHATFYSFFFLIGYLSQVFFFNGSIDKRIRYAFPGYLFVFFTVVLSSWLLSRWAEVKLSKHSWRLTFRMVVPLLIAGLIMSRGGFAGLKDISRRNVERTQRFHTQLEYVVATMQAEPESILVIESNDVWDVEPIYSLARYFQYMGMENAVVLKYLGGLEGVKDHVALAEDLNVRLLKLSRHGDCFFQPVSLLDLKKGGCYSMVLSGPSQTGCVPLGGIYGMEESVVRF